MAITEYEIAGFNRHLGIQLIEWEQGHCVLELPIESHHLNRAGVVHGGVISTLIDAVGSHAGNYAEDGSLRPRSVTVAMTTQFIGQAKQGPLRAVGTRARVAAGGFSSRVQRSMRLMAP